MPSDADSLAEDLAEADVPLTAGEASVAADAVLDPDEYEPGEKRPLNHGVKIRAKLKRGTGTRDQDVLLIEGRGEDAAEASQEFEAALAHVEEAGVDDRLRALQPDEDGENDD